MKVTSNKPSFKAFEIVILVESEKEVEALRKFTNKTRSDLDYLTDYNDLKNIMWDFEVAIQGILNNYK